MVGMTASFDPGPPPAWAERFAAAPLATYESRPELFRVDFGPVTYRGRLDGTARLLVVGQDPSVNEIMAHRVFVGQSGQRLQGFLTKLGLTRSYVMLNTFLFSIFGQFGGDNAELSREDPILGHRNSLFDAVAETSALQAVLTVGTAARDAVDRWPASGGFPRAHILHPAFPDTGQLLANWNIALADLGGRVGPDDGAVAGAPYGSAFAPGDVTPIPRGDLPFGLPAWHGDGDHARRAGDTVIEWHAPRV
jgi:Uracil DNA glycosylase superfamily